MANDQTGTKRGCGGKIVTIGLICCAVLVIPAIMAMLNRDKDPIVAIPNPVMPNPNAFDFDDAAGKALLDKDKIDYAIYTKHSPSVSQPADHDYSLAEKAALVRENDLSLTSLREGFKYPYHAPPVRSLSTLFRYAGPFRDLARLLVLDGQVKAGRGDWAGAANSDMDALQLGAECPHGATLIGMLIGNACQAIGRRPLWDAVSHLDTKSARAAALRMNQIQAGYTPFGDIMQEEKWYTQASLMEIFHNRDWRGVLAKYMAGASPVAEQAMRLRLAFESKREIMERYTEQADKVIAFARAPYAAKSPPPAESKDAVISLLMPVTPSVRLRDAVWQAENRLMAVALALQAYHGDNHAYPPTLAGLVPKYLPALPDDPFALSGSLQYRIAGAAYVLYSIGPDGKDDGGKPIINPRSKTQSMRYQVDEKSTGDIVAGINK